MGNIVSIGTSLDGFISAPDGSLEWLSDVPIPKGNDLGSSEFMETIDVVVMGRKTFGTLLGGDNPLFADLEQPLCFEFVDSRVLLGQPVRRHYGRKRACPLVQEKSPNPPAVLVSGVKTGAD